MAEREYPDYLRGHGFRFVERLPGTNKVPIRQASSRTTVPEHLRMSSGQFGNMLHNQRTALSLATSDQIQRGMDWYPHGHRIAEAVDKHDVERASGVLAALSGAGTEWGVNVRNARHFLQTGQALPTNTTKQIEHATRIAEGEHFRNVLPKGLKEYNFAELLANPEHETAVAVDTHHHDSSTGLKMPWKDTDRGLQSIGRYNTFADATRSVAAQAGMRPSELQAVNWLVWKELGHPYRGHPRAVDIVRRRR